MQATPGTHRERTWHEFARRVDGDFRGREVLLRTDDWVTVLELAADPRGSRELRTCFRACFPNPGDFRFTLRSRDAIDRLGGWFIAPGVRTNDPQLDRRFVLRSNFPESARALFADAPLRAAVSARPGLRVTLARGPSLPEGVDELTLSAPRFVGNLDALLALHRLFGDLLRRLDVMDRSGCDELDHLIRALRTPGDVLRWDGSLGWDGEARRRRAARRLAELRETRAVPVLIRVIPESDPWLRSECIRALGKIGDSAAVPTLVALLGAPDGRSRDVEDALERLGEGELVRAFRGAQIGDLRAREFLLARRPPGLVTALCATLEHCGPSRVPHVAAVLARLGAAEARPAIRKALREHRASAEWVRRSLERSLHELDAYAALPRPAAGPKPQPGALPLVDHR